MISELDVYNFDLNGFVILKNVLSEEEVSGLNEQLETIPPIGVSEWHGHIQREELPEDRGISYQQIYELGSHFEKLIDHPAYIDHVKHFVGNQNDFDAFLGPLYIDECFALIRGKGERIGVHSGGHTRTKRTQFSHHNGQFQCGQVNVFIPLTDIGPGDGGTLVVPGSHKANFQYPGKVAGIELADYERTVEVHLNRGDVLIFVDAICHGSAERKNDGLRKTVIYRYGPAWGNSRYGYLPSLGLLERLTAEQRKMVQPQTYRLPPHLSAEELKAGLEMTSPYRKK